MKLFGVIFIAAFTTVLAVRGEAQEQHGTAIEVMKGCRAYLAKTVPETDVGWWSTGYCAGAVSAISGAAQAFPVMGICMPRGVVTLGQGIRVVTAYIDARPNRLHEDFRKLVLEALKDAWPCTP